MNPKDQVLLNFKKQLLQKDYSPEDIDKMSSDFLIALEYFEVSEEDLSDTKSEISTECLLEEWNNILLIEGKSVNTIKAYRYAVLRLQRYIEKDLLKISLNDLRLYFTKRQQEIQKISLENERSYLGAFYTWLYEDGYIDTNPMSKIKRIKFNRKHKQSFTEIEIDKMRSNCNSLKERAMMELFLSTGLRVSELSALDKSDVDLRTLIVNVRSGKGDKSRIVLMSSLAAEHLRKYLESRKDEYEWLFNTRLNTRWTEGSIRDCLRKLSERCNIQQIHPHKFRRTFATKMSKNGAKIEVVQSLMGHVDVNTTRGYIAFDENYIQNQAQQYIE